MSGGWRRMQEYFNYFTEIEERFCQRRGSVMLCSTLDWALMETWKDAGLPLEAVLRGIDAAFDRHDARSSRTRKINSLAWCAQEVLAASEEMKEAAVGAYAEKKSKSQSGLDLVSIASFLDRNARKLEQLLLNGSQSPMSNGPLLPDHATAVVKDTVTILRDLAAGLKETPILCLEDIERRMTVLEEKILAVLLTVAPDDELVALRAEADRAVAPYRRKMIAAQIAHLYQQFVHKRLLERFNVPRLSLFYME